MNKNQFNIKVLLSIVNDFKTIVLMFLMLQSIFLHSQEYNNAEIDKLFSMSIEELKNVKVTSASKKAEKISDIPASVVVITHKEIETYGYSTLTEILENVPGLYNIDNWEMAGSNFGVRGFWTENPNRNIVFLVNGVSQIEEYAYRNIMGLIYIPVESIDRIEIIRGPMSVIYGSGAFFGSVNIITNEVNKNEKNNLISGSIGTMDTYRIVGQTSGAIDDLQYTFSTGFYKTQGIDIPMTDMGATSSGNTSGIMNEEKKYFSFSFSNKNFFGDISYNENFNTKPFLFQPHDPDNTGANNPYNGRNISSQFRTKFGYKREINEIIKFNISMHYYKYDAKLYFDIYQNLKAWEKQYLYGQGLNTEVNTFITLNNNLDFLIGSNYYVADDLGTVYDLPKLGLSNNEYGNLEPLKRISFFSQGSWKLTKQLRFIFGARVEKTFDYDMFVKTNSGLGLGWIIPLDSVSTNLYKEDTYSNNKWVFIPRSALIYSLSSDHIIKLLYGHAINNPSYAHTRDAALSDLQGNLKPENISTIELNYIGYLHNLNTTINFSIFNNNMKNLIIRNNGFDNDGVYFSYFNNSGEISTNGIEVQIKTNLNNNLSFDVALTLQDTKNKSNNIHELFEGVSCSPKILSTGKISYKVNERINIAITGNYVGRMRSTWNSAPQDFTDPNSPIVGYIGPEVSDYLNVGTNLRIDDLVVEDVYLNLRITNILDKDIFYPVNTNQPWPSKGTMGLKRAIMLSLGYRF